MKVTIGGLALTLGMAFTFGGLPGCASGDKDKGSEEAVEGEGDAASGEEGDKKKDKKGAKKDDTKKDDTKKKKKKKKGSK